MTDRQTARVSCTESCLQSVGRMPALAGDAQVSLSWNASSNAASYNVKRSTMNGGPYILVANVTMTNFIDNGLINGTTYYYVVSGTNAAGESANSVEVSVRPVSTAATQLNFNVTGGQLQFTWPADYIGWTLQAQTNSLSRGLGTNWVPVANSSGTNQMSIPIDAANGSVFFRLVYP